MPAWDIAIFLYSYIFSGLIIYQIDYGIHRRYQAIGFGLAVVIFLCYVLFVDQGQFLHLNYGFLTLPMVTIVVFNIAGLLSWKISGREFRATWRGGRYFYTEKKNGADYLLSCLVILVEITWPFLVAIILNGRN